LAVSTHCVVTVEGEVECGCSTPAAKHAYWLTGPIDAQELLTRAAKIRRANPDYFPPWEH
jgi:hypothetical protein